MRSLMVKLAIAATLVSLFVGAIATSDVLKTNSYAPRGGYGSLQPVW
jgi:hypothetical protein